MDNLALHMRITGLAVSNDDVDSRKKAITDLANSWKKSSNASNIVAKANEICVALGDTGTPPPSLLSEVESAIQKRASAFLGSESPLEIGICAAMAIISVISQKQVRSGWTSADIYSSALWSGLSFQAVLEESKREKLRNEVLELAREKSLNNADSARNREDVPDPDELLVEFDEEATTTNFKEALQQTVDSLRRNAALDREELDFLWWSQLGHSRALKRPLTEIPEATRLITMALEAADLLRRLPANVHHELVLRTVERDPELDLSELIEVIGADRAALGVLIPTDEVSRSPNVYPLLYALISAPQLEISASRKLKASEWANRALLEAGLAQMVKNGIGEL